MSPTTIYVVAELSRKMFCHCSLQLKIEFVPFWSKRFLIFPQTSNPSHKTKRICRCEFGANVDNNSNNDWFRRTKIITYCDDFHIKENKMAIATNNKTNTTISVLDTDIVCGRGKGLENFPGNRIFRQFIKQHAAEYGNPKASRSERSQVVQFITSLLIDEGMRFVKRETKGWVVLGDHEVKLKVCSWDACRINETLFFNLSLTNCCSCLCWILHSAVSGWACPSRCGGWILQKTTAVYPKESSAEPATDSAWNELCFDHQRRRRWHQRHRRHGFF